MKKSSIGIIGLGIISFSVISYVIGFGAFEELIGQSSYTDFFSDEMIKSNEKETLRIASYFGSLGIASIPIFLVGIPITVYGFIPRFSVRMAIIMGILLLCGLVVAYFLAYPFT